MVFVSNNGCHEKTHCYFPWSHLNCFPYNFRRLLRSQSLLLLLYYKQSAPLGQWDIFSFIIIFYKQGAPLGQWDVFRLSLIVQPNCIGVIMHLLRRSALFIAIVNNVFTPKECPVCNKYTIINNVFYIKKSLMFVIPKNQTNILYQTRIVANSYTNTICIMYKRGQKKATS